MQMSIVGSANFLLQICVRVLNLLLFIATDFLRIYFGTLVQKKNRFSVCVYALEMK